MASGALTPLIQALWSGAGVSLEEVILSAMYGGFEGAILPLRLAFWAVCHCVEALIHTLAVADEFCQICSRPVHASLLQDAPAAPFGMSKTHPLADLADSIEKCLLQPSPISLSDMD